MRRFFAVFVSCCCWPINVQIVIVCGLSLVVEFVFLRFICQFFIKKLPCKPPIVIKDKWNANLTLCSPSLSNKFLLPKELNQQHPKSNQNYISNQNFIEKTNSLLNVLLSIHKTQRKKFVIRNNQIMIMGNGLGRNRGDKMSKYFLSSFSTETE